MILKTRTLPAGTLVQVGGLPVRLMADTPAESARDNWEAIDDYLSTHALSEPSRDYDPPLTMERGGYDPATALESLEAQARRARATIDAFKAAGDSPKTGVD